MKSSHLVKKDLRVVWHPCTQMKDHEKIPMIPIKSGKGVWLYDYDGKKYLDAISSWWVNLFVYSNAYINKSIKSQLSQLEHVLLAGFTHEPAVTLSERLIKLTPPKITAPQPIHTSLPMDISPFDVKSILTFSLSIFW